MRVYRFTYFILTIYIKKKLNHQYFYLFNHILLNYFIYLLIIIIFISIIIIFIIIIIII